MGGGLAVRRRETRWHNNNNHNDNKLGWSWAGWTAEDDSSVPANWPPGGGGQQSRPSGFPAPLPGTLPGNSASLHWPPPATTPDVRARSGRFFFCFAAAVFEASSALALNASDGAKDSLCGTNSIRRSRGGGRKKYWERPQSRPATSSQKLRLPGDPSRFSGTHCAVRPGQRPANAAKHRHCVWGKRNNSGWKELIAGTRVNRTTVFSPYLFAWTPVNRLKQSIHTNAAEVNPGSSPRPHRLALSPVRPRQALLQLQPINSADTAAVGQLKRQDSSENTLLLHPALGPAHKSGCDISMVATVSTGAEWPIGC